MLKSRLLLFMLMVATCFTACKKDASPGNANKRLQRIVSGDADSIAYISFHYDAGNRVIGYTYTDNHDIGFRWETTLQYDAQDNPVTSYTNRYYNNVIDTLYSTLDSLLYQNNRVVKKFNYYYYGQLYQPVHVYSYNANGNMLADTSINNFRDGTTRINYTNFTYDGNGNIVQWESFPKLSFSPGNPIIATYNTTPNAYSALGNRIYFLNALGDSDIKPTLLSKYNVSSVDYGIFAGVSFKQYYQYQYDQDGFISKIIVTGNDYGSTYTLTTTFYYE